jgi:hypothetical protein
LELRPTAFNDSDSMLICCQFYYTSQENQA